MTRKGQRAYEQLEQWRSDGVPDYVTAYEAYRLTGGIVGVPYGTTGATKPLRLIDVAVRGVK
jgi:hypothetical protein